MSESGENKTPSRELVEGRKVAFQFVFSSHVEGAAVDLLKKPFAQCDIYIPECVGWSSEHLGQYRATVNGLVPSNVINSIRSVEPFLHQEALMINDSHKPIILVDIPQGHRLIEEYSGLMKGMVAIRRRPTFEETLEAVGDYCRKEARIQRERELYMLSQLKPKIEEAIKDYPKLREKKELKVLMSLGAMHRTIFNHMKQENYDVNEIVGSNLDNDFESEAKSLVLAGEAISPELSSLDSSC